MNAGSADRRPIGAAVTIALMLALAGVVLIWDASFLRQGGGYSGVGPGAVPKMVGGALLALAVWTVIAGLRGDLPRAPRQEPAPVLWILGGLLAQLLLLYSVGFTVAAAVLFAMTARGFGQRNLPLALGIGLVLSLVIYFLFDRLLRLNLPGGPIENLLFGG